jgi:hypothetical protein
MPQKEALSRWCPPTKAVHLSWHFLLPSLDLLLYIYWRICHPILWKLSLSFFLYFSFASLHICIVHCVVSGLGDFFLSIYLFLIS